MAKIRMTFTYTICKTFEAEADTYDEAEDMVFELKDKTSFDDYGVIDDDVMYNDDDEGEV